MTTQSEIAAEEFRYPVGDRTLTSVDAFRAEFLPGYYELEAHGERVRRTLELLLHHGPAEPRRMLDYGCGAGTFAHQVALRRPEWTITGWEGDYAAHRIAEECFATPNLSFARKPYGAYAELAEPQFDVVTFLEVIEHVDDPGPILSAFRRGLAEGGLLVLSTPNFMGFNALTAELRRMAGLLARRRTRARVVADLNARAYDVTSNSGHVALYSLDTLTTLLRTAGFELVDYDIVPLTTSFKHRLLPETLVLVARKLPAG